MKVLYFSPVGTIGGAEMCLLDLLAALERDRPDIRPTVVLGDDGPLRSAIEALGLPVAVATMPKALAALGDSAARTDLRARSIGKFPTLSLIARMARSMPSTARYLVALRRLFASVGPDLVQTNGMKAHLLGAMATPRGVPVVWHLHDYVSPRPVMARLLKLASSRKGISAVAVSRSVLDDARSVLPTIPIRAIYNAVDVQRFSPALEPTSGPVRVGLVATFARWKGHTIFLDAISRLAPDLPARYSIVGGPIYRSTGSQWTLDELKAEASRLGVLDRVNFVGHVDDPASAFRLLDVAVHASTRPEPFGRSIVEGMATGLAVVATGSGGSAELFEDGVSALACPPNDPAAMAELLGRLIVDANLRRSLGEAARREVLARFDADGLAEAWAPVYLGATRQVHRAVDTEVRGVHV